MSLPARRLNFLAALAVALLSGCSFLFVDTPPTVAPHTQPKEVDCTSSKVAPVLDTIFGGLEVVRTGVAIAADDSDYSDYPISREADIGFGLGFTALFAASAVYGYINTGECADLRQRVAASPREERREWTPPPAAPAPGACTVDTQCKGDRICEQGRCVAPPTPTIQSPVPLAPPSAPDAGAPAPAQPPAASAPAQPAPTAPAP